MKVDMTLAARKAKVSAPLFALLCALDGASLDALLAEGRRRGLVDGGGSPTREARSLVDRCARYADVDGETHRMCLRVVRTAKGLWPDGVKIGTSLWRGNDGDLASRLEYVLADYGDVSEAGLDAAFRAYADAHRADTTYMRTLPNFILRAEVLEGEDGVRSRVQASDLMDWVEAGRA